MLKNTPRNTRMDPTKTPKPWQGLTNRVYAFLSASWRNLRKAFGLGPGCADPPGCFSQSWPCTGLNFGQERGRQSRDCSSRPCFSSIPCILPCRGRILSPLSTSQGFVGFSWPVVVQLLEGAAGDLKGFVAQQRCVTKWGFRGTFSPAPTCRDSSGAAE